MEALPNTDRLQIRIQELERNLAQIDAAYAEAALAVAVGERPEEVMAQVRAERLRTQQHLEDLQAAVKRAREIDQAALAAAVRQSREEAWQQACELLEKREKAAAEADLRAEALGKALAEVAELGRQVHATLHRAGWPSHLSVGLSTFGSERALVAGLRRSGAWGQLQALRYSGDVNHPMSGAEFVKLEHARVRAQAYDRLEILQDAGPQEDD